MITRSGISVHDRVLYQGEEYLVLKIAVDPILAYGPIKIKGSRYKGFWNPKLIEEEIWISELDCKKIY